MFSEAAAASAPIPSAGSWPGPGPTPRSRPSVTHSISAIPSAWKAPTPAATSFCSPDNLIKSYLSLEQKLGAAGGLGVPGDPNEYDIKVEDALFESDPDVNARLHAAGFSNEQAQTVYDLAAEYLSPLVNDVAAEFHAQNQIDRLAQRFGGEDQWRETAVQIKQWGQAHFPDEVFQALSCTLWTKLGSWSRQ